MKQIRSHNRALADAGKLVRWRGYVVPKVVADAIGIPLSEQMPTGTVKPDDSWIGAMADEVEKVTPEAVGIGPHGFKMVNYNLSVKQGA